MFILAVTWLVFYVPSLDGIRTSIERVTFRKGGSPESSKSPILGAKMARKDQLRIWRMFILAVTWLVFHVLFWEGTYVFFLRDYQIYQYILEESSCSICPLKTLIRSIKVIYVINDVSMSDCCHLFCDLIRQYWMMVISFPRMVIHTM